MKEQKAKLETKLSAIIREYEEEVIRSVAGLFYLLQGIENLNFEDTLPTISSLKTYPVLPSSIKASQKKEDVLRIAFKGWVDEVFQLNERLRHKEKEVYIEENRITKLHPDDKGYIPPELDFLGDFRHIRNDFIHSGRASVGETGKCKVLKWFAPPEKIVFTVNHVLEFLIETNQIQYENNLKKDSVWKLRKDVQNIFLIPHTKLISIRTSIDQDGTNNQKRLMIACIFNDGVFGIGETSMETSDEDFTAGQIDLNGDIRFPSGKVIRKENLYELCLKTLKEGRTEAGGGIYGPWMRFRR